MLINIGDPSPIPPPPPYQLWFSVSGFNVTAWDTLFALCLVIMHQDRMGDYKNVLQLRKKV